MSRNVGEVDPQVMEIAREQAQRAARQGSAATILAGSHTRGDAHAESDIDLYHVGDGPHYVLERVEPFLVSVSWRTVEQHRKAFISPDAAGAAVPAWRSAVIVHDPAGVAS